MDMSLNIHWEYGSDFHLIDESPDGEASVNPWDQEYILYGSGRDALRALVGYGMKSEGWKRIWIPGYFCQTVVQSIVDTGIAVQVYSSWYPGATQQLIELSDRQGDVVLAVNHFGLDAQSDESIVHAGPLVIIEDHSHDPWSKWAFNSKADYCIASLRKTLPIPDGGVLWSPVKSVLPKRPVASEEHMEATEARLSAMRMKAEYLSDRLASKKEYLALFQYGEQHLAGSVVSAISLWSQNRIPWFPVTAWRVLRRNNVRTMKAALAELASLEVLGDPDAQESVPFSAVVLFSTPELRDFVRARLISEAIYPAILWPLDQPAIAGITDPEIRASNKVLSLPCDMRYSEEEVRGVAEQIWRICSDYTEFVALDS